MRTLDEIKRDLSSYRALAKRKQNATLYADKYVEDVGALVDMLEKKMRDTELLVQEIPMTDIPVVEKPPAKKTKKSKRVTE